jgi:spore coat polysaccharide biosynthesis protein SpsF (cytidylyltransferase family)
MRVVALIQARLASTRLPGKVLADLGGKPVLQHVIDRVRACVSDVFVATPINDATPICGAITGAQVIGAVGRLQDTMPPGRNDVLGRFAVIVAGLRPKPDAILRVTGDCPFWCPDVGDDIIRTAAYAAQRSGRRVYTGLVTADTTCSGYPDGTDAELFSRALLERADKRATWPGDREHVTRFLRRQLGVITLGSAVDYPMRLSIDTADDLLQARLMLPHIPAGDYSLTATARAWEAVHGT